MDLCFSNGSVTASYIVVLKADEVMKNQSLVEVYISDLPEEVLFTINNETLVAINYATEQITTEGQTIVIIMIIIGIFGFVWLFCETILDLFIFGQRCENNKEKTCS